jgi:phosphoglycolate phosphatase
MGTPAKPLVLFDVDGTLLLTGGAGMRAMKAVAAELFGEEFRWDGIVVSGHLDPLIFAEATARNGILEAARHHERFRALYLERLAIELALAGPQIRIMPGIRESLSQLRQNSAVTLGLLTGNYAEAIPMKLATIGIEPAWFEITACGDEGDDRRALAGLAITKYERRLGMPVDPARVIVVGDTPRDVDCAHAHCCFAFAVATGGYSIAELEAAGADAVVSDLADPTPLLETISRVGDGLP